jgi:hypothetical protein
VGSENAFENTIGPFLECVALFHRQVFLFILWKNRNKKNRESFITPDIHNPGPAAFPHPFTRDSDLAKPARSTDHLSTFRVSRNQCHDVSTLLLAKELIGNREVGRRLDNRLHNSIVLHWTPWSSKLCAVGHPWARALSLSYPCYFLTLKQSSYTPREKLGGWPTSPQEYEPKVLKRDRKQPGVHRLVVVIDDLAEAATASCDSLSIRCR